MYRISKQFTFSSSHVLDQLPDGHPCSRAHGHNYVVTIHLRSKELNEYGFVKDYTDLKCVEEYLNNTLDHRHLNDVIPYHPTAENIARYLFEIFSGKLPELCAVEVSETPKASAIYEP